MSSFNWDYMAWDENGKNTVPIIKCLDGTLIELYKNRIYLRIEGKTISVYNGELEGNSFYLYIERFKLSYDAIFVIVDDPNTSKKLFGIATYGWSDKDNWFGIPNTLRKKFIKWVKSLPEKTINPIVTENDIPSSFEGL
ncbi:MAG: hypothetical protein ACTSSF_00235 [Candidatus Heimdallarchaeaceae archaeon]